jgi:outer membrane protein assembly factor BamB
VRPSRLSVLVLSAAVVACRAADPVAGTVDGSDRVLWGMPSIRGYGIPAFDAGTVYALGNAHDVAAVDKQSGALRWRATLPVQGGMTVGENLVLATGLLIAGDSTVHALDPATGRVVWSFTAVEGSGSAPGRFRLATDGTTIYAGSANGNVYAIDAASGRARWVAPVVPHDGVSVLDPKFVAGVVYVGYTDFTANPLVGGVAAVDAATGTVRWSRTLPQARVGAPTATIGVAVAGGTVVAGARDGNVYGLAAATGAVLWIVPPVDAPPSSGGNALLDVRELSSSGTTVYAASTTGVITAIDAVSGAVRWMSPQTKYGSAAWITSDDQQVYVTHTYGQMTVLDAGTGAVRWQLGTNAPGVILTPAIDGERLYVDGATGVYAVRAR